MALHHNLFSHSLILHKAPNPDQTSCYLSSKYLYGQRAVGTNFHLYHIYNFFFLLASRIARRRRWHPTPVLLPGKSHGWRSLVGCGPWGCEESDTTEQLPFRFSLSCIGEGNGNPPQCSCLENPRDGGAWRAAVYGVAHSRTRLKRLSSSRIRMTFHPVLPQMTYICFHSINY